MPNSKVFNPETIFTRGYRPIRSDAPNDVIEPEANEGDALIQKSQPPKDHYKIVYFICFLQGAALLLGWNVFITAAVFFRSRFLGSPYSDDFQNYFSVAYMSSHILFFGHALCYLQMKNPSHQVIIALAISTVKFLLVAISIQYIELFTPSSYFYFIIFLITADGITTSYHQNGIFGIVSQFSPIYVQAVMSGEGLAGTVAALAQIFSAFAEKPIGGNALLSEDELARSAYIYFLFAFVVTIFALISCFVLFRSPLYQYYVPRKNTTPNQSIQPLVNRPLINTFRRIRILAFAMVFVFIVTLGVFPSITSAIGSVVDDEDKTEFQKDYLFIPLHFLIFNLGDWLGRHLPTIDFLMITDQKKLAILSICRIVFIPIFLFCNVDVGLNGRRIFPLLVNSDLLYFFFLCLFSLTNGYLCSLIMMIGSQVAGVEKGLAGTFLAFCLVTGLTVGSIVSFPLRYLSCGGC